jgi:DNA topoisomerase-1
VYLLKSENNLVGKNLSEILNSPEKSAEAINLIYVRDAEPGINRIRKGKKFIYVTGERKLKDNASLERIKKLVIPPAWENVWICKLAQGHLQATGFDLKKRKQYKYHSLWCLLRNETKFHKLYSFGKSLPVIRKQIDRDLSLTKLSLNKVLAAVISLMQQTGIRIGNDLYEKLYGSFGLTTLKDKHVKINGASMKFVFRGKKGITHSISIRNKRLSAIVKKCRDIPGEELFQYLDEDGEYRCVDSGMVNAYIKKISGRNFSAKDFRTWAGSLQMLIAFKELGYGQTAASTKANIIAALDSVAKHLGNTREVCKKYYVHPCIVSLYEEKKLLKYFEETHTRKINKINDLKNEEQILLKILKKESGKLKALHYE